MGVVAKVSWRLTCSMLIQNSKVRSLTELQSSSEVSQPMQYLSFRGRTSSELTVYTLHHTQKGSSAVSLNGSAFFFFLLIVLFSRQPRRNNVLRRHYCVRQPGQEVQNYWVRCPWHKICNVCIRLCACKAIKIQVMSESVVSILSSSS